MASLNPTTVSVTTALRQDIYEQVLDRFGFDRKPDPSIETLNAIYKAWCRRIGYDNALKRIYIEEQQTGPFPVMDPNDFLASWMQHGTSGSCWPSAEALFGVLELTGFMPERVAGQMLECNDPMNPNHGALIVHLDGRRFYVDPGIGAEEALELIDGQPSKTDNQAFGIWNDGDGHVWWRPGHSRRAIEIVMDLHRLSYDFFAYRYEKTKEFSLFNTTLYVRRNRDDGILTYGRGNILRVDPQGELTAEPIEPAAVPAFLIEQMGLSEEIVSRIPLKDEEGAKFE
jgi:arylamine N-acetyltransferase